MGTQAQAKDQPNLYPTPSRRMGARCGVPATMSGRGVGEGQSSSKMVVPMTEDWSSSFG